jgi:condensin complex subunit 2
MRRLPNGGFCTFSVTSVLCVAGPLCGSQVDVRVLKETLWRTMVEQRRGVEGALSFQDVISAVPSRGRAGKLEDLSVHLCFICMLHLANEHGLAIADAATLDRMTISGVPSPQ